MVIGALVGTFILAPISDALGRKPVLLGCIWTMAIFGICSYWATLQVLYAFQFIRGMAIAVSSLDLQYSYVNHINL